MPVHGQHDQYMDNIDKYEEGGYTMGGEVTRTRRCTIS